MTATISYLLLQLRPPRTDIPYLESPQNYSENHFFSVKSLLKFKETPRNITNQYFQPIHLYEIASGNNLADLYLEYFPASQNLGCYKPNYFADKFNSIKCDLCRDRDKQYRYYQIEPDRPGGQKYGKGYSFPMNVSF